MEGGGEVAVLQKVPGWGQGVACGGGGTRAVEFREGGGVR